MTGSTSSDDDRAFDVQGHRGARGLLPENTIPSFLKALELGASTLEMDVVITADDEVILSHEPWISSEICSHPDGRPVSREEERSLNIFRMTLEAVQRYDCGLRRHPQFPRQETLAAMKPLLRDVILASETYRKESGIDLFDYSIETKSRPEHDGEYHPDPETFVRLLYDVLVEDGILDRSIIQSFDVRTLQAAQRLDPSWRTALLVEEAADVETDVGMLGFVPTIYSPDVRLVNHRLVRTAHRKEMRIIPWTVNRREDLQHLLELGVDGVITDYPDVAREIVEARAT